MPPRRGRLGFTLAVLFGLNLMNFYDRQVVGAIGERIREEWRLSDARLAALSTAFILLYAVAGLPLGRRADVGRRRVLLGAGALVWSAFTALSGVAATFPALVACRLGVGIGEASCAPTANSLLGDLVPPGQRSRAMSAFMLGLPLGLALSYWVSGWVVEWTGGWRPALFVAGAPGVVLGLLAFLIPEPGRVRPAPAAAGAPWWSEVMSILRIPTMGWIILSGAVLNFSLYAMSAFLTSYMVRYHGLGIGRANLLIGGFYGIGGGVGMLLGGWLGDRAATRRPGGRLALPAAALGLAVPFAVAALALGRGAALGFSLLMLPVCALHYFYYGNVYAAIQDVVGPSRRGLAMAVYFLAFYLATAAGLLGFGGLSDSLAARFARGGVAAPDASALGLHAALYLVPVAAGAVALVLWAGARRLPRDRVPVAAEAE